jgi:hypothetical protein
MYFIYLFRVILTTNSDCHPKENFVVCLSYGDKLGTLLGTN